MWQTSDIRRRIEHASVFQRVYAQDCNLNNNGVIHPETICAAAERPTFHLLRKGYTSIEKKSTSSSCDPGH